MKGKKNFEHKTGMKNYEELLSQLNWKSFINFKFFCGQLFRCSPVHISSHTHLTCHFRKAIASRADAGNHGGCSRQSVKKNINFRV